MQHANLALRISGVLASNNTLRVCGVVQNALIINNNLFIYSALFDMLGDQKRITTINNLKTINTNIRNIQIYLISKRY